MKNQTQPAKTSVEQTPLSIPQVVYKSRKISIISIALILTGLWVISFSYTIFNSNSLLPNWQSCDTARSLCHPIVHSNFLTNIQAVITMVTVLLSSLGMVLGVVTIWGNDTVRLKYSKKIMLILILLFTYILFVYTGWHQKAYF